MNAQPVKIIAAENCHWYAKDGRPVYEVPYADPRKGMKKTTLADARKLDLVPGYSEIESMAAKPGLVAWKLQQLLEAALTLPRIDGETLDQYASRVLEDAEAQSAKARDRGTSLHEAIEHYILGQPFEKAWNNHILAIEHTLQQYGLDLLPADAEKTFATDSYGGKIDWKQGNVLLDFKTKDRIEHGKPMAFMNHVRQLAAYYKGCNPSAEFRDARLLSVFVGVEDQKVFIHEWPQEDIIRGYQQFVHLLAFWKLDRKFGLPCTT